MSHLSEPQAPDRDEIVGLLATLADCRADQVTERIGSLELTWLITRVEERHGVTLDLSDDALASMTTITGAVAGFRDALTSAGDA
jgi:hypothetical protein